MSINLSIKQYYSTPKRSSSAKITCQRQLILPALSSFEQAGTDDGIIRIKRALSSQDYRAAAYLRAQSFYTYPEDRSEFARRVHFRMKADEMWEQIEQGIATSQQGTSPFLIPLIATTTHLDGIPASKYLQEASVSIPADNDDRDAEFVIGTLDVNIGAKLPAEELIGKEPSSAPNKRAYLSNVCVLSAARRRKIASKLIEEACKIALENEIQHMYVHVVAQNEPARKLYENQCGFHVEQEEEESFARSLNRPRRLLLHRQLM